MRNPGPSLAVAAALAVFSMRGPAADDAARIQPEVVATDVQRIGVNLGYRTSWGAEQLMSNVIMNPGFEGIVDGCLVTSIPLDRYRFLEQNSWLGRPDQFWIGAAFQIRTGQAAGYTGRIVGSKLAGAHGLPEFTAADPLPAGLAPGDRIALSKTTDDALPTQWWIPADSNGRVTVNRGVRPGSAGMRSLELHGERLLPAEIHSYLDAIGDRAGNLLPVTGNWHLCFWSRAISTANLSIRFARGSAPAWVEQTIALPSTWQMTSIDFEGAESGGIGTLDLRF